LYIIAEKMPKQTCSCNYSAKCNQKID